MRYSSNEDAIPSTNQDVSSSGEGGDIANTITIWAGAKSFDNKTVRNGIFPHQPLSPTIPVTFALWVSSRRVSDLSKGAILE